MKRYMHLIHVLIITSVALYVRFTYNLTSARYYFPLHDSLTYQTIALHVIKEHCYCLQSNLPTVDRAPLWPMVIAGIYSMFKPEDIYVRAFLCFVGTGTCLLIYFFAKDLFRWRIGLLAGLIAAIYPFLYIYDGWLYSESLYAFLFLAFCYTLYHFQKTSRLQLAILGGILTGLLGLTRPNGLGVLGLVIIWGIIIVWKNLMPWKKAMQGILIMGLISLALIVPWSIRNYNVSHALVPVAIGDGKVLLGAYNDMILQRQYYLGIWIIPSESNPQIAQQYPQVCNAACEVRRDADYEDYAEEWISTHANKMAYLLSLHFLNLWQIKTQEADLAINRFPDQNASHIVVRMMVIITPIVFILAASGLLLTLRRWREFVFIYLMILFTIGQAIVFYGIPRFRAPIEPLLIILAAGAIWWVTTRLEAKKSGIDRQATEEAILTGSKKPFEAKPAKGSLDKPSLLSIFEEAYPYSSDRSSDSRSSSISSSSSSSSSR